ncbi:hypothetical protein FIBSPDRAFT_957984 [Athelia psychrophila]|uniref:EthD domain-containing protein n=1 Tax=Athelia psychrophila TaxID=1759441 RepID=A0A166F457_9AGAM|nr:hypothetical protein FIBSPDRAFT_957984 [Fibularhizoctonia sp. CBS 109695]
MPTGFLAVWANTGPQVTADEFSDWYDNEHVPLRTALPTFLSAARFSPLKPSPPRSSSAPHPEWLALYDVVDPSVFQDPTYTTLRANRSPREVDVVSRTALLDRRMYEYVGEAGASGPYGFGAGGGAKVGCVITQGFDSDDAVKVEGWLKGLESAAEEARADGLIRSRVFQCVDAGKNGTSVKQGEPQVFPKYLVVHEFSASTIYTTADALKPAVQKILRVQPDQVKYVDDEDTFWVVHHVWETVSHKA